MPLVARENKSRSLQVNRASLELDLARAAIQDPQEQVVADPSVELVEDDDFLAVVAVEPEVLSGVGPGHDVGVGVGIEGPLGLAGSRVTPPDVDLGGDVAVAGLAERELERGDAAVELDELDRELVGDVPDRLAVLDGLRDLVEVAPVLTAIGAEPTYERFMVWPI